MIAHQSKTFGGGLDELRRLLAEEGYDNPLWYEVPKSRKAPKKARRARKEGAELVFVWGGDGMVQRCVDALAGSAVTVAIVPAGTANLLAANLGIPRDLPEAVRIGLHGARRRLDLGRLNGEHFVVMAGAGFDGGMIRDADGSLKARLGRLAYVWTGMRKLGDEAVPVRVRVDDADWFDGTATCVLLGNVGPPRVRCSGPVLSAGWSPARPGARRSCAPPGLAPSTSRSAPRWCTSWTVGRGRRPPGCGSARCRRRSRCACRSRRADRTRGRRSLTARPPVTHA